MVLVLIEQQTKSEPSETKKGDSRVDCSCWRCVGNPLEDGEVMNLEVVSHRRTYRWNISESFLKAVLLRTNPSARCVEKVCEEPCCAAHREVRFARLPRSPCAPCFGARVLGSAGCAL